ncbi:c-type cytochrome biogenesis protein CcmI, partial [Klebsiella pneumoniae]
ANLAILREQLKEIERDKQAGVLSAQDFEQAQMDLRQRVLEENEGLKTEAVQQTGAPRLAWTLMLSIPLAAIALYFYLGNPVMLDPA